MTLQVESWDSVYPDVKPIFAQHWRELAVFQDKYPYRMDVEKYTAMDANGTLVIVTAREEQKLAGYIFVFVMEHPHYKGAGLMALTDMYFVLPEYRKGAGARLFLFLDMEMRRRGVIQLMTSCKCHEDHTEFLEALGYSWTDKTFCKYIGGAKCP